MGGKVTHSLKPFVSSVTVGDSTGGGGISGSAPALSPSEADSKQFENDDLDDGTPEGAARADAYVQQQVANGTFSQAGVDAGNAAQASQVDNTKTDPKNLTPANCEAIHSGFNLSTLIAPSTTLGNFIKDLPVLASCKNKSVPAQMGLDADDIVCNLSNLCTSIWEPLKAQYPNAILTNSLRTGSNIGAGPHGTGQGMDVQFTGMAPRDYFAVAQWVKGALPYDQLILEYHTARGPIAAWLHISIYAGTGKKAAAQNRVLTMMNHKIKSVGLSNLAG